jgi:hypothetical protein
VLRSKGLTFRQHETKGFFKKLMRTMFVGISKGGPVNGFDSKVGQFCSVIDREA